jgi:hypothetical protein
MSRITPGWLAHHTPQSPGGRQAALIDIAQDLLLTRLHQRGVFDHLEFKGGTALRKLYAGSQASEAAIRTRLHLAVSSGLGRSPGDIQERQQGKV